MGAVDGEDEQKETHALSGAFRLRHGKLSYL